MRSLVLSSWLSLDGYSFDRGTEIYRLLEEIDDPQQDEYFVGRLRKAGTHILLDSRVGRLGGTRIARGDTTDKIARLTAEPGRGHHRARQSSLEATCTGEGPVHPPATACLASSVTSLSGARPTERGV